MMDLPWGWEQARVDRVATVNARIGWKALTASEYQDSGYIFLSTPNIKGLSIDFSDVNYISEYRYLESPELMLQKGDVLLAKDGSTLGITAVVEHLPAAATVNGSIAVIRPFAVDSRFLRYVLASDMTQALIGELKGGMGVPHLFQWDINRLPVPMPPPEEQRRIADFLDDQITRIDQIIASRRQQVALLRHAVLERMREVTTIGMGDPRRSTGIGWMPEAARDWPVLRVAQMFRTGSGTTPTTTNPAYFGGDIPWVNTGDITDEGISEVPKTVTEAALVDFPALRVFQPGALVVAMYGQGATKGRVALLPMRACVNQACCVLEPTGHVLVEWAASWFRAHKDQIVELAIGSGQPNLSQEIIRSLRMPAPPTQTQRTLLAGLFAETTVITAAGEGIERSIELLQEFKRSLISAAVSGEFDVASASGRGVSA